MNANPCFEHKSELAIANVSLCTFKLKPLAAVATNHVVCPCDKICIRHQQTAPKAKSKSSALNHSTLCFQATLVIINIIIIAIFIILIFIIFISSSSASSSSSSAVCVYVFESPP